MMLKYVLKSHVHHVPPLMLVLFFELTYINAFSYPVSLPVAGWAYSFAEQKFTC